MSSQEKFEQFYKDATHIQWGNIRFSVNGLSLIDVSPINPDLHHTDVYVMFDMMKQVECENKEEIFEVYDREAIDVRCGLFVSMPAAFVSACLTYKHFNGVNRKRDLTRDEIIVYSFACAAIKAACRDFDPDKSNHFIVIDQSLNHE